MKYYQTKKVLQRLVYLSFLGTLPMMATTSTSVQNVRPDNSKVNERDASGKTLTAQDQAMGSERDVEITRLIRKDISASDLSVSAKNIKIITMNGDVTLRGPVDSSSEKEKIYTIAQAHVKSPNKINNNIQVK